MMKKLRIFAMTALAACSMQAQIVFQDSFSNYTNGALSGQGTWSNSSSQAGLGACAGAICSGVQVVDHTTVVGGIPLGNKAVQFGSDMDACGTFFTPITSGDFYFCFVVNLTTAPSSTSSNDFIRVSSGNNFNTTFRIFCKAASGSSFFIGATKGASSNPAVFSTNGYTYGADHYVIVKYSMGTGTADDTITVYVDPVNIALESLNTPALTNFTGTDQASSVDRFALRCNATNLPSGYFAGTRITRTWADIFSALGKDAFTPAAVQLKQLQCAEGLAQFELQNPLHHVQWKVYDLKGALVSQKDMDVLDNTPFSFTPITQSGVYMAELVSEGQRIWVQKIAQ